MSDIDAAIEALNLAHDYIKDLQSEIIELKKEPNYKYDSFEEWAYKCLDGCNTFKEAFEAARETKERKG